MSTDVVVVTGASRGLGRGMARAFGSKGATVYITGRDAKGPLADVAEEVTKAGGKGIAVQCDHAKDSDVEALFKRIDEESGKIDILVNNAATLHVADIIAPGPFWEKPLRMVDLIDVGTRSNYVTSYYAAPMMVKAKKGLIANISFYGSVSYFHGPAYGAGKAGNDKMAFDMAVDLRPHNVAAVSVYPGLILTEMWAGMTDETVPEQYKSIWPILETPEFTGLVIDALYRDPKLMYSSGKVLIGAELGEKYGIKDINGKTPPNFRASMGNPPVFFEAPHSA